MGSKDPNITTVPLPPQRDCHIRTVAVSPVPVKIQGMLRLSAKLLMARVSCHRNRKAKNSQTENLKCWTSVPRSRVQQ